MAMKNAAGERVYDGATGWRKRRQDFCFACHAGNHEHHAHAEKCSRVVEPEPYDYLCRCLTAEHTEGTTDAKCHATLTN
jgi:hypothetical protein